MAADGYIVIDTKLNTATVNKEAKSLGSSLSGALKGIFDTIKGIGKALALVFIGGSLLRAVKDLLGSFDFLKSSIGDKFKPLADSLSTLKGAFVNLVATAIVPLLPYIVTVVQWFTQLLFTVTKVIAALFGMQKTIGGVTSETKKATKETKGALAAFDQINVLQQQQATQADQAPFITPAAMDVPQSFLDKIAEIKKIIKDIGDLILSWWNDPVGMLQKTWAGIVAWFKANVIDPIAQWWNSLWISGVVSDLWNNWVTTWKNIIANTVQMFQNLKTSMQKIFQGIIDFFTGIFTGNWALAWQGIKEIVDGVFGAIFAIITGVSTNILLYVTGIINQLKIIWAAISPFLMSVFSGALNFIRGIWGSLSAWFTSNINAAMLVMRNAFDVALAGIKNSFVTVFGGIWSFVSSVIKGIINQIQTIINFISSFGGLFGSVPVVSAPSSGLGSAGGGVAAPPRLATGAVIPPNSQFAAILGDQRSGTNIEAPTDLIRQIVMDAISNSPQQTNVTVTFDGTLAPIVREMQPHIKAENVRVGRSLAK